MNGRCVYCAGYRAVLTEIITTSISSATANSRNSFGMGRQSFQPLSSWVKYCGLDMSDMPHAHHLQHIKPPYVSCEGYQGFDRGMVTEEEK